MMILPLWHSTIFGTLNMFAINVQFIQSAISLYVNFIYIFIFCFL
jgi:hypothetical protein